MCSLISFSGWQPTHRPVHSMNTSSEPQGRRTTVTLTHGLFLSAHWVSTAMWMHNRSSKNFKGWLKQMDISNFIEFCLSNSNDILEINEIDFGTKTPCQRQEETHITGQPHPITSKQIAQNANGDLNTLDIKLPSHRRYDLSSEIIYLSRFEASTEWPPFCRRHFQIHFHVWNCRILIEILLKFVPKGVIYDKQALFQIMSWSRTVINLTNAGLIYWRIHASTASIYIATEIFLRYQTRWNIFHTEPSLYA